MFYTITPVILSTAIYQSTKDFANAGIFSNIMDVQGMAKEKYETLWGMYTGKFNTLVNVPLAIANAVGASVIPSLTAAVTSGNRKLVYSKIQLATRFTMIISIPSMVGCMVLARPVLDLLFSGNNKVPALLLITGSVTIVFYSLSTITNAMLQGVNRMTIPIRNAAISLVIHLVALFIMLVAFKMNIFAVIGGTIVFSFSMCVLNQRALHREIGYKQEKMKTFVIPLMASIIMGVVALISQMILEIILPPKIATVLTLFMASHGIWSCTSFTWKLNRRGNPAMPKGHLLVKVLKKVHLLKEGYY